MSGIADAFDGFESSDESNVRGVTKGPHCPECGEPFHEHDKERDYDNDMPGAYSYDYICG